MPTVTTRTVKSSGGDYTSLSLWEADTDNDLVTADVIEQAECHAFTDTTAVTIAGATVDATRYRRVYPAAGAEAGMPWRTSGAYILQVNGSALSMQESYCRVERIQIDGTATTGIVTLTLVEAAGRTGMRAVGVFARLPNSSPASSPTAISAKAASGQVVYAINCVALKLGGTKGHGYSGSAAGTTYLYNCTSINAPENGFSGVSAYVMKNCLAYGSGGSDFAGAGGAGTNYNASEDTTAPGTNPSLYSKFSFIDTAGGNYRLALSDASARNVGKDLSVDANFAFNTDFDGNVRGPGGWDIGAFQTDTRHYLERSHVRTATYKDRYPWIWTRALRYTSGGGAAAQSATVGAAPVVVHAPGVTVQRGAATRAVSAAPIVVHAPTVATSAGAVSRTVGAAPLVVHAPTVTASAAAPGTQTATVSAAGVVAYAPAVATSVGAVQRAIGAAPVVVHAPQVSTTTGTVTRVVASGVVVAHAPAVTVTIGAATRTVGAVGLVVHAPGVNTTTGTVTRAVAAAPLILHAPSVRGTNAPGQTRIVGAAAMVLHAPLPSAYILLYPTPPLYAPVDELRALAVVDDLRATVSVDDLATRVSLY